MRAGIRQHRDEYVIIRVYSIYIYIQNIVTCRHWIYAAIPENVPFPLSLLHPHWLIDGPGLAPNYWAMAFDVVARDEAAEEEGRDEDGIKAGGPISGYGRAHSTKISISSGRHT